MKFFDNLQNFITNLGILGKDKKEASYFEDRQVTQDELNAIYKAGGIGGKAIDCVAEDLIRKWREVSIPEEDSKKFTDLEAVLKVVESVGDEVRWSRLYGGAGIGILIGDEDPREPLDVRTVSPNKPITGLRVFHKDEIQGGDRSLETGRLNEYKFRREQNLVFHPSRVLGPLDGIRLPTDQLYDNGGWGRSVLGRCYDSLVAEATAAGGIASIMHEAKTDVISVKALSQYLDGGTQQAAFEKRYALAAKMKSITNLLLLDADVEKYEAKTQAASLQGLAPLMERFANRISAEVDIPMTRLFGKLASGLSTSGETNQQDYYDMLTAFRKIRIIPQLVLLDELICRSVYGRVPDGFTSKWKPFRELTEVEQATVDKTNAETAEIYLEAGCLVPGHVARTLVDSGPFPVKSEFAEYLEKRDGLVEGETLEPDLKPEEGVEPEPGVEPTTGEGDVPPEKEALNGAQTNSLVEIAKSLKLGEIEPAQAEGIIRMSFPKASEEEIKQVVTVTEVTSPPASPAPPTPPAEGGEEPPLNAGQ